ncbi:PPC domain-containing DNA-binding protein [Agathobaculum sp.]|uniref:PPC domain-containing DNA-binding protein n=1 Tax=Agathobaculum sp. TaxID=2048138 RepID=UPI002A81ED1B|nr:PPC domain-containing DNA-binding protein [Agathobaculum sp.]MDY3617455.1 PPC domain-containing DNA-binding protein [Agathobaculum sp.]
MEYKRFDQTIIARIDKGEEIVEKVKELAEAEHIKLADVSALGAVGQFTVGVFKTKEKKYLSNEFSGDYEIVSLTGTINTMDDKFYCHLHMSAGNEKGEVFGGHLNRAVVSATCEMVIHIFEGTVDRCFNQEVGLNLFQF